MTDIDTDAILKQLSRLSIPMVVLDKPYHFRLQPLIRQSLNNNLRRHYSTKELDELYRSAADHYCTNDAVIEAVDLLLSNHNYEAALTIIEKDWLKILSGNGFSESHVTRYLR